jgi:hypothetical protein
MLYNHLVGQQLVKAHLSDVLREAERARLLRAARRSARSRERRSASPILARLVAVLTDSKAEETRQCGVEFSDCAGSCQTVGSC